MCIFVYKELQNHENNKLKRDKKIYYNAENKKLAQQN